LGRVKASRSLFEWREWRVEGESGETCRRDNRTDGRDSLSWTILVGYGLFFGMGRVRKLSRKEKRKNRQTHKSVSHAGGGVPHAGGGGNCWPDHHDLAVRNAGRRLSDPRQGHLPPVLLHAVSVSSFL
jgi:hypothetical protein